MLGDVLVASTVLGDVLVVLEDVLVVSTVLGNVLVVLEDVLVASVFNCVLQETS